ncbi:hypothetical protein GXM_08752 [Nostoc sphaeroides CCNUC1]|uniref:Uncharacterized protein n=1 Tax=Nostoc sphaeroides CCNUC1 TaxID=2653204 RepID=A0A5P8WER4_9NOSO|nr:hypothetical protein GXM_08752 [Nostoc sphaeroides CCNUC1]
MTQMTIVVHRDKIKAALLFIHIEIAFYIENSCKAMTTVATIAQV